MWHTHHFSNVSPEILNLQFLRDGIQILDFLRDAQSHILTWTICGKLAPMREIISLPRQRWYWTFKFLVTVSIFSSYSAIQKDTYWHRLFRVGHPSTMGGVLPIACFSHSRECGISLSCWSFIGQVNESFRFTFLKKPALPPHFVLHATDKFPFRWCDFLKSVFPWGYSHISHREFFIFFFLLPSDFSQSNKSPIFENWILFLPS